MSIMRAIILTLLFILFITVPSQPTSAFVPNTESSNTDNGPYEPNDTCEQAQSIVVNGGAQEHNFQTEGDVDWIRFDGFAGTRTDYLISVDIPDGSLADIELESYPSCDIAAANTFIERFVSNVRQTITLETNQTVYLRIGNIDNSVYGEDVIYQLSVQSYLTKNEALIIAPGRLKEGDRIQRNLHNVADQVYQVAKSNNYNDEDIYYIATDETLAGYDAAATLANLQYAITEWAAQRLQDNETLDIYLVGHGDANLFNLDNVSEQNLTPTQLDTWLTELERKVNDVNINVVLEVSQGGSFISSADGSISGVGRIIVASTNDTNDAYASQNGAYFSDNFIAAIQQESSNIYSSFKAARDVAETVSPLQKPWLDANGNGIPNEDQDMLIALQRYFLLNQEKLAPTYTPTWTPTPEPTPTPSNTPTEFPTFTPTDTFTPPPTWTPTPEPTSTPTNMPTEPPTFTPTNTFTPTFTWTPTPVPTSTPTNTPTEPPTFTPTDTPKPPPTWTPTDTPTPIPTWTLPPPPTWTATHTPKPAPTWTPSHTPTTPPTATPPSQGDANNRCDQAITVPTDGSLHDGAFETAADLDWFAFEGVADTAYRIGVDIPGDSPADVNLELYPECDAGPTKNWIKSFAPGVQLNFKPPANGKVYMRLTNDDVNAAGNHVRYTLSVRQPQQETGPGAVIILAGRLKLYDELQDNIHAMTDEVFTMFQERGYTDDAIYYLATSTDVLHYDASATLNNLRSAIVNWAAERVALDDVPDVLTLYMMDHGDVDVLYLDEPLGERLTPTQLDGWLDELEDKVPGIKINVIIEACYAGSFIQKPNSISGPDRLIVTSSDEENVAYASSAGAHFSEHFLTALRQGDNLLGGWSRAKDVVEELSVLFPQRPWLDGDGDGVPNEVDDFVAASRRGFAYSGTLSSNEREYWPPYIAQATGPSELEGNSGLIRAEVRDDRKVSHVWAVIYPPSYVPPRRDNELIDENLETIRLVHKGENIYEGRYSNFNEDGVYRIIIHADDADRLMARPFTLEMGKDGRTEPIGPMRVFLPLISR